MHAVCHTPQATCSTVWSAREATWQGSGHVCKWPCPSLPQRPSPQEKSRPPDDTAQVWKVPHDTCTEAEVRVLLPVLMFVMG